jgi:short-subunit dehydrogenase
MVECGSDQEQPRRDDGALIVDLTERYGPWAVIAGGSEGVSASVARLLGDRGVNVILVARRKDTLDETAVTVVTETRAVVLDLNNAGAADALAVELMSQGAAALHD